MGLTRHVRLVKSAPRQTSRLQESLHLPQALRGPMEGACALGAPGMSPAFPPAVVELGVIHDVENPAIFSPQRSQPPATRRGPLAEKLTQTRRPVSKSKPPSRRLLAVYTGASSPSLFSSLLSALCAVGHVQASADAASSIAALASHVRIFHLGPSLQRLAKYSAVASALAS